MLLKIRNAFLAGLIIFSPLAITLFVINFLREKVGSPLANFFVHTFKLEVSKGGYLLFDFLGILLIALIITSLGFLSQYFFGRYLIKLGEKLINTLPFVNKVYSNAKEVIDTFSTSNKALFKEVVIVQYPQKDSYVIGFLTGNTYEKLSKLTGFELVNVFVPTTPNPTSGFLLMIPKQEVIPTCLKVSEGIKMIVSGGALTPEKLKELENAK